MKNILGMTAVSLTLSLFCQNAFGAAEFVEKKKVDLPKELREQIFVMETLPPAMLPKFTRTAPAGTAKWLVGNPWPTGSTLTVAFNGAQPGWEKIVADAASEWSKYGDIHFDFGFNPSTGSYRQWDNSNTNADIRIGFGPDGHWSFVGTDCKTPRDDKRTMNLNLGGGEPQERWRSVILHEFGHTLGFNHEHQHPDGYCDDQFMWEDEDGYKVNWRYVGGPATSIVYFNDAVGKRPGVYKRMISAPNGWGPMQTDFQMRQMSHEEAAGKGVVTGPVDRKSIMHYGFDPDYFKLREKSECCIQEASEISEVDKLGLAKFYPPSREASGSK